MVVHRQILFSLTIAAIAEAIVVRTSAEQVPSLHRVAPRYWELVTSSCLAVHANICTDVVRAVGQKLLFSVLISITCAVALSTSLVVRS